MDANRVEQWAAKLWVFFVQPDMVKLNHISFGCTVCSITFLCLLETLGCSIDEKGFHQVELQIAAWDLEVEKIGFCVLYKHDIEDRNWGKMEYDDTFFCWWWNLVFEDPNRNKWIHDEDDGVEPRFKDSDDWIMANHMRNFFLLFFYLWVISFLPTLINHFSFLCAAYVMLCFFVFLANHM